MNQVTTEKTHSADGSVTISEIARRERAWADEQPMTVRCAFCRWSNTGPAARARATAERHRLKKHPELAGRTKRTGVDAAIAVSRAARVEREDQERLAKVERGRRREQLARPVLEEAAVAGQPRAVSATAGPTLPAAERPAASSSTYTPKAGTRPERVMAILANGAKFGREIQAALGETGRSPLSFTLFDLERRGAIVRLGRGLYALPGAAVSEREPKEAEAATPLEADLGATDSQIKPQPIAPSRSETTAVELDLTIDTRAALLLMRSDVARLVQTTEWLIEKWQNETGLALEEAA